MHRREREDLAVRRLEQPPHIVAPDLEAASGNTGYHVVILAFRIPQRAQALNAGNLVPCCAVVFGELRLDERDWRELIRDDEIRRLIKTSLAWYWVNIEPWPRFAPLPCAPDPAHNLLSFKAP